MRDAMPTGQASNQSRAQLLSLVFAAASLLVLVQVLQFLVRPLDINHDVAMYLQAGNMLLDGAVPYIDVIELNPPLVWYLHVIPVWLGRMLGVSSPLVAKLLLLLAACVSAALTYRLLTAAQGREHAVGAGLIALTPLAALLILGDTNFFGQREHLFVLALLPYFSLRAVRYLDGGSGLGTTLSITVGLLLAATALLKAPHFGGIVVAGEILLAWRCKTLRPWLAPEVLVAIAFLLVYVGHFLLLPEGSWRSFWFRFVPLISDFYGAYDIPSAVLWQLFRRDLLPQLALLVVVTWMIVRKGLPVYRELALLVLLAGLLGGATFILQHKGWEYHRIPTIFAATTSVGILLAAGGWLEQLWQRVDAPVATHLIRGVGLLSLTAVVLVLILTPRGYRLYEGRMHQVLQAHTEPGEQVMLLSDNVYPGYPLLVQNDLRSGSRYLFLFTIAMLYKKAVPDPDSPLGYALPAELKQEEKTVLGELADDIARLQPQMILIAGPAVCQTCQPGFDLRRYFLLQPQTGSLIAENYAVVADDAYFSSLVRKPEVRP